jgi:hypothetical protein
MMHLQFSSDEFEFFFFAFTPKEKEIVRAEESSPNTEWAAYSESIGRYFLQLTSKTRIKFSTWMGSK